VLKSKYSRIISILIPLTLSAGFALSFTPLEKDTVRAIDETPGIVLGTRALSENMNTPEAATVFLGTHDSEKLSWRVIGFDGEGVASSSNEGCVTLLSGKEIGEIGVYNRNDEDGNAYAGSVLQSTINRIYEDDLMDLDLQGTGLICGRTLLTGEYSEELPYTDGISGRKVENAKLWPLSANEAYEVCDSIRAIDHWYWLRSPGPLDTRVYNVNNMGVVDAESFPRVTTEDYVRPAFNLNMSSVLLTTPLSAEKESNSVGAYSLASVKPVQNPGNEWKLTIRDKERSDFTASMIGERTLIPGKFVDISFSGGKEGENEYISAIFSDMSGNILYYGRLAEGQESGIVQVRIPYEVEDGEYVLMIYSEQCNASDTPDLASSFSEFAITIARPAKELSDVRNLKASGAGTNKVRLTWDAVEGAAGYLVYAQKSGQCIYLGMTRKGTSYMDEKALDTEFNYYFVFPFVEDEYGVMTTGGYENYAYAKGV